MKILILMSYFNRPKLVRNALNSILKANENHADWELAFGDDGSDIPGRPIVEEVLREHLDRISFYKTDMTFEDKVEKGLILGSLCNEAIKKSTADIGIMFCDDDELFPFYLKNLSDYFVANPQTLYCWSMAWVFNPLKQTTEEIAKCQAHYNGNVFSPLYAQSANKYNNHGDGINPVNKVDASQVAWRLDCCKQYGAWFAETTKFVPNKPWTKDTDKSFFESLYEKCGPCAKAPFLAQYKGVHDYQLLWHKNTDEHGLRAYYDLIKTKAGVEL